MPCTCAILTNQNQELLLTKRAIPPNQGSWDLPGGFMNINETAEEAIAREIKEELDIIVPSLKYFTSQIYKYYFQKLYRNCLIIYFEGKISQSKKFNYLDDVSEAKFFKLTGVPFTKMHASADRAVIRQFINQR